MLACPTHARHYGDFDDPDSNVSKLTAERGGFGLLEELGYKPVNRYLPPREPPAVPTRRRRRAGSAAEAPGAALERLIALARRTLAG